MNSTLKSFIHIFSDIYKRKKSIVCRGRYSYRVGLGGPFFTACVQNGTETALEGVLNLAYCFLWVTSGSQGDHFEPRILGSSLFCWGTAFDKEYSRTPPPLHPPEV